MLRLPEVLAGPIVRRSTVDEVNVWLATSVPLPDPELLLFEADDSTPIVTQPSYRSVQLGLQLYVHMLTAHPDRALFPAGIPIAYDITAASGRRLGHMLDLQTVALPRRLLPIFSLQPPDIGQLHALYGSCRKLHGPKPDMMRAAEKVMQTQPAGLPEVFFLGGDQIYADDVSHLLIRQINDLSIQLIGRPEVIPGMPATAQSPAADRGAFLSHGGARAIAVSRGGHVMPPEIFTSHEMKHHLLTFGEYAATYLLAWNPELWRREVGVGMDPSKTVIPPGDATSGARAARRVLANVVTYMVFDDHEVTDDWFRTGFWKKNVLSKAWGARIIVNGLCAYWAFQGWGNDPASFPDEFVTTMGDFTNKNESAGRAHKLLLGWKDWSYLAPTSPPALVLDTRTHREISPDVEDGLPGSRLGTYAHVKAGLEPGVVKTKRNVEAPRLIGSAELRRLQRKLAQARGTSPLIVIAPSPVFGFGPVEAVQELASKVNPDVADLESWAANPRNISDLVRLLLRAGVGYAVVLSGDVHYAFELAASVATAKSTVRVAQFCSSAMKNAPAGFQRTSMQVLRYFGSERTAMAWWDFADDVADGPITRYWARSRTLDELRRAHSGPSFIISQQLELRHDKTGVVIDNNIGELKVDDSGVRNRFWQPAGTGYFPSTFTHWEVKDWPARRIWPPA